MKFFRLCPVALLIICSSLLASTDPIATQNRNALVRLNGLPSAERAELLAAHTHSYKLGVELSSQFVSESNATEQLLLDGETAAVIVDWRYGLSARWELGVTVPVLSQGGGFLDGFVEGWHSTLSLPDGNRDSQPRNQLLYSLQNGQQNVNFSGANTGVGDIAVQLRTALYKHSQHAVSAFARLELPTGTAENFTGSNATDIALGANYSNKQCLGKAYCHASAGVLWFGNTEVYRSASRSTSLFGSATIAMPLWRSVVAKLQLDTHQAMYNSNTEALGDQAFQLSFGIALPLGDKWDIDIAMSEDISPNTAPDFTFVTSLAYRP